MLTASLRAKTCAHCQTMFMPARSMQAVCSPVCARRKGEADKKAEKAKDKAKREDQKTIHTLIAEAQVEFNKFIRLRDQIAGHPCISSGRPLDWSGNNVDAGHYRSTGAASHLRFDERNCHAQSKHDNQWKAGNVVDYRINLIKRIGLEAVEALEADNEPVKWDRDALRQIKTIYRAKARQLLKERA
ncbi:recombination protein NinG [Variovorax sp. J22R193]|uniref:recombination protein NinG n=1 Tax=Variovorax fucosicus TaxID=3053517 RepID=UPI0025768BA2|nr:recombination protein NinG [Variovorax sp. J22R193]MDM0041863.1 recombination protein NinG [Variovorax sp. J22R193]